MEEKTINIMDLVMLGLRHIWAIILAAAIFAGATFGYCKLFITPTYSAKASILVTNGAVTTSYEETTDKVSGSDIQASLILANTIVDILRTDNVYKKLEMNLGEGYNFRALKGHTSVSRRNEDTLFIDITFSSTDGKEAMRIVNKFAEVACEYIPEYIPSARANVASTSTSAGQTAPRTMMTTGVAGVLGAVLAYVVVFIFDSLNRSIKGEEDFTNNFDVPLLGSVPDFENAERSGYRKSRGKGGYGYGN